MRQYSGNLARVVLPAPSLPVAALPGTSMLCILGWQRHMGHMALSLVRVFLRSFRFLWGEYGA
jgi:hypothetical protein